MAKNFKELFDNKEFKTKTKPNNPKAKTMVAFVIEKSKTPNRIGIIGKI
jgi:hypothetical protein